MTAGTHWGEPKAFPQKTVAQNEGAALAPPIVDDVLRAPGEPLESSTRVSMEQSFAHDFSRVRVHSDARAAESARAVDAAAYTVGRHVVFGKGQYVPATRSGRQLLAHELAHVVQQGGESPREPLEVAPPAGAAERDAVAAAGRAATLAGDNARVTRRAAHGIQRQPAPAPAQPIGARAILPFQKQQRFQIDQSLSESLAGMLGRMDPRTAAMLKAVTGQRATVTTSTDDLVEADLDQREITLPEGATREVRLRLERSTAGTFTFEISGISGDPPVRSPLFTRADLTAVRSGGGFVLSEGAGPTAVRQLGARPRAGGVDLRVFADSFIDQVPELLRGLVPGEIEVLSLSELPPAQAGSEAVERAAREAAQRAAQRRTEPRQQVELGVGPTNLSDPRLLLRGSWQYTFRPLPSTGSLFGMPLQLSIQYAPRSEVLGRISAGAGTSLSALKIPLNVRVLAGVSGGQAVGPQGQGVPVAGVAGGIGVGLELARWRVQLDADHVVNIVNRRQAPGSSSVVLSGGFAF